MRTPKQKKIVQKARSTTTNRLRKKAMKNKVIKKTLLAVGGDDTREEVRDLMNESNISTLSSKDIEPKQKGKPVVVTVKPSPEKDKPKTLTMMSKSLSLVTMKTKETTEAGINGINAGVNGVATEIMKKTRSLRALRSKRKLSNEENIEVSWAGLEAGAGNGKVARMEVVPAAKEETVTDAGQLSYREQTLAKLSGVKNILQTAILGVPYAKVLEDPCDISVCEPELQAEESGAQQESSQNCVVS